VTGRDEDGFLQRWSRRKQEAARPPAAPPPASPDRVAAARAQVDDVVRREAEADEREALLARLPKLEDLTAQSDFRAFMHPLVPAALRSAALSRMWTLDPAIRDFVGPARDYAWDWNVPGGVPGGGPAPSLADVQSMLSRLTARMDAEAAREAAGEEGVPAPAPVALVDRALPAPATPGSMTVEAPAARAAVQAPAAPEPQAAPAEAAIAVPRRRHGGATPV
jgi:hypothetical protein